MDQVAGSTDRIYWHPDLHFGLHEYVRYYRVQVVSRYSSRDVFASFKSLCERWNVGTYSIFEVYGSHDLIIRMYAKQSRAFNEAFIKWMRSPVTGMDIRMEGDADDYDTCLFHWLWTKKNGQYDGLPDLVVEQIRQSPREMSLRLRSANGEADRNLANSVLRIETAPEAGIRFIVMITGGEKGKLSAEQRETLARDVLAQVLEIKGIKCLEAYRGSVDGWLIFDGRVEFNDYFSINQLKDVITRTRVDLFGCRATTYLCCDNINGVEEIEELYVSAPAEGAWSDQDLLELLSQPENEVFETKGSLRMNMDEFFRTGQKIPIKIDKDKPDPILKTIAAFANCEGGVLIVGALEEQSMAKKRLDVTSLPEFGEYRLCGIDADFLEEGFDKAQRHLMYLIRKNMDAGTSQLVEIRRLTAEGRELMAVIVQKNGELKPYMEQFYIRNGAQTDAMKPTEIIEYMKRRR